MLAPTAGPASAAGDDYPYRGQGYCQNTGSATGYCSSSTWIINGGEFDPWGFGYRNCTSFVAWRMRNTNGVDFYNTMRGGRWGNANTWDDNARNLGYTVDHNPAVGSIAQTDAGTVGHVAWVSAVGNGTVTVEQYNKALTGEYSTQTVATSTFVYIHVHDLAGSGVADGSFVSHNGYVYRIVGGAPIYVSTWNVYGGAQPTTPLSDAQFASLPRYPRDGTLINASGTGYVYKFAGGAPLYVSSWTAIGGSQPSLLVDSASLNNAGSSAEPWSHIRTYPADGTLVAGSGAGRVYRFAGGAPLYVSNWDHIGGSQPTVGIDQAAIDHAGAASAPWNHVRKYPADGTLVAGYSTGYVYKFAGGAPLYVSNWDHIGGSAPVTAVDQVTLEADQSAEPFGHVLKYPADGTVLTPPGAAWSWQVKAGTAKPVPRTSGVGVDQTAVDNAGLGRPWNHLVSSKPHARLAKLVKHTTAGKVRVKWPLLVTSSVTTGYDVRWQVAGHRWHHPKRWRLLIGKKVTLTGMRHHTRYCVAVRGHDAAGITGPWSKARCVTRT